jgi:hypothetical protein
MISAIISVRLRGTPRGITINKWRDGFVDRSRRSRFKIEGRAPGYLQMQFSAVASFAWPRMNGR